MTLTFLGTRGNIDVRTRRHRRHTSTLVSFRRERVMVDCGADWLDRVARIRPTAIVLTHSHPDHVDGLRHGAPCGVYATADVWERIRKWPLAVRTVLRPHQPVSIGHIVFEPVPVDHSVRAPAVGYRIMRGDMAVFYAPDVLDIPDRNRAFAGVELYIGDGASLRRPIQRKQDGRLVGHTSIAAQIGWCAEAGVRRAIFTHCGTSLVTRARAAGRAVAASGEARGVVTRIAYDGLLIALG